MQFAEFSEESAASAIINY